MEVPTNLTDRYELNAHIARGGMADVYQGRDSLLGRKIAVKVVDIFGNDTMKIIDVYVEGK